MALCDNPCTVVKWENLMLDCCANTVEIVMKLLSAPNRIKIAGKHHLLCLILQAELFLRDLKPQRVKGFHIGIFNKNELETENFQIYWIKNQEFFGRTKYFSPRGLLFFTDRYFVMFL